MQRLTNRILEARQRPGGRAPRNPGPSDDLQEDAIAREFEKTLWDEYGLTGAIVPDELLKECQHRLQMTDPGSDSRRETEEELQFLDQLHRYRKQISLAFARYRPDGIWENVQKVEPSESMRAKGARFWAVIIGNDRYPGSPLSGCVNDAHIVERFIITYLNVPHNHIRLFEDADHDTIINALYDLRDNDNIQPGDNILIHFSGHGSSYNASDYFKTFSARHGSIEAICPIDRDSVSDISERELNSIFSEIAVAKGDNITVILDCCHSGGGTRNSLTGVRFIHPIRRNQPLGMMLEAANMHPRRSPASPSLISEMWRGGTSSFVLLAACQDFQFAEEFNAPTSDDDLVRPDPSFTARSFLGTTTGPSPRHGRFTWALIKILESDMGINATYTSVIDLIGKLSPMQVPVAVGSRKHSKLWFEE